MLCHDKSPYVNRKFIQSKPKKSKKNVRLFNDCGLTEARQLEQTSIVTQLLLFTG